MKPHSGLAWGTLLLVTVIACGVNLPAAFCGTVGFHFGACLVSCLFLLGWTAASAIMGWFGHKKYLFFLTAFFLGNLMMYLLSLGFRDMRNGPSLYLVILPFFTFLSPLTGLAGLLAGLPQQIVYSLLTAFTGLLSFSGFLAARRARGVYEKKRR